MLIVLINDESNEILQYIKMNLLLKNAFKEYDADIVCVLDVEEFIITTEKIISSEIIEDVTHLFITGLNGQHMFLQKMINLF